MATGAKMYDNQFQAAKAQVTPDEIDMNMQYIILHPGTAQNAFGTAAAGTSTQTKAFVITNQRPDYPRNALLAVSGSNDIGAIGTVVGFDQFGYPQNETIGSSGTFASAGTQFAGTKIWSQITGATASFAVGSAGNGTMILGYAGGTGGPGTGLGNLFGLPTKIRQYSDVKAITWDNNTTTTALLGGTVGTQSAGTMVGTANYTFMGTHVLALTDAYILTIKPTWDNSVRGTDLAHLSGTP